MNIDFEGIRKQAMMDELEKMASEDHPNYTGRGAAALGGLGVLSAALSHPMNKSVYGNKGALAMGLRAAALPAGVGALMGYGYGTVAKHSPELTEEQKKKFGRRATR